MAVSREEPVIAEILRRVERLEAERAILATLYRYSHAHDHARDEEWVGLFAKDGVFDARRPASGRRNEGREALRRYRADIAKGRKAGFAMKHTMSSPLVTIDGDTARVEAYFLVVNNGGEKGSPRLFSFGRYEDRLVKEEGEWRFQERIVHGESYA